MNLRSENHRVLDLAMVLVLFIAGAIASWYLSQLLAGDLIGKGSGNVWFDGDSPRVYQNLTSSSSNHYRTQIHPISSLLLHPFAVVTTEVMGLSVFVSVRILMALVSGLALTVFYWFARLTEASPAPATAFAALFATSAAFIHWSGVPELFLFSALTLCVLLVVAAQGRSAGYPLWVVASALSLSVTITNWMFGVIATFFTWDRPTFVKITTAALGLVAVLSVVQLLAYENAKLFFDPRGLMAETHWTQLKMEGRGEVKWTPFRNLWSQFVVTVVAPRPEVLVMPSGYASVNNHYGSFRDTGLLTLTAAAAWTALFSISTGAALLMGKHRRLASGLVIALLGQAALHSIYGFPTFLYSFHFLPFLIGLVVLAYQTRMRALIMALTLIVCLAGGISNYQQFRHGADALQSVKCSLVPAAQPEYCQS